MNNNIMLIIFNAWSISKQLLKGILLLLIHFIISFSSGSLTLSEPRPVPKHLLKDCLEAVVVSISLKLSKMILSFRYKLWNGTVWLLGFEIVQK
jgi:hypothetical protein